MGYNFENNSALRKSDDLLGSSDSLIENHDSPSLEQLNYKAKQNLEQNKSHEIIDKKEHKKADLDLENDIENLNDEFITSENLKKIINENFEGNEKAFDIARNYLEKQSVFGRQTPTKELLKYLKTNQFEKTELSNEEKIKSVKSELTKQGKSQSEILKTLIAKFENEEAVSTWVENWKNFQRLSSFAKNKPPRERTAIQNIISKADFSSENSFASSLQEISQSEDISNETKLQISREFRGEKVTSLNEMNAGLQHMKTRKAEFAHALEENKKETIELDLEISELEDEIKTLALNDPKRKELETQITKKQEKLMYTKLAIRKLKFDEPKDVSFKLREGFSAKLNEDGSRSIRIDSLDFDIKLPSNRLPFTDKKNLRSINLSFPFKILKELKIADVIFSQDLVSNSVPSKSQRDMGHLILSSLGINDRQILTETEIAKLKKSLGKLVNPDNGKSGREDLIESGVFNVERQEVNVNNLSEKLRFLKMSLFN